MSTHAGPCRVARRRPGTCQDCGRHTPTRVVTWWASGFRYRVCAECERAYRDRILWPVCAEGQ